MTEAVDIEHLRTFLECSICLEKYDNPKPLSCTHHFCKGCLEDIIAFNEDGSAVINCPMRCTEQTIISNNQTVNDLVASYDFKGVVEALKMKEEVVSRVPSCTYNENCGKDISVYCCGFTMCRSCFANHKSNVNQQHQRKTNLFFNKKESKLKVLCNEHVSQCTHLCVDNKFLCVYCLHRDQDHKNHTKHTVERNVELLKAELLDDSNKMEKILQFLKVTEDDVQVSKQKLDDLLETRAAECLSRYTDLLNKEKEDLKSKFESICENHTRQYPSNPTPNYSQEKLNKSDIVLAIEKETIQDTISKNINLLTLNCATVSVSETFDYRSEHPLGDVLVTDGEQVLTSDPPLSTLKNNIKTQNERIQISTTKKAVIKPMQGSSTSSSNIEKRPQEASGKRKVVAPPDRSNSKNIQSSNSLVDNYKEFTLLYGPIRRPEAPKNPSSTNIPGSSNSSGNKERSPMVFSKKCRAVTPKESMPMVFSKKRRAVPPKESKDKQSGGNNSGSNKEKRAHNVGSKCKDVAPKRSKKSRKKGGATSSKRKRLFESTTSSDSSSTDSSDTNSGSSSDCSSDSDSDNKVFPRTRSYMRTYWNDWP